MNSTVVNTSTVYIPVNETSEKPSSWGFSGAVQRLKSWLPGSHHPSSTEEKVATQTHTIHEASQRLLPEDLDERAEVAYGTLTPAPHTRVNIPSEASLQANSPDPLLNAIPLDIWGETFPFLGFDDIARIAEEDSSIRETALNPVMTPIEEETGKKLELPANARIDSPRGVKTLLGDRVYFIRRPKTTADIENCRSLIYAAQRVALRNLFGFRGSFSVDLSREHVLARAKTSPSSESFWTLIPEPQNEEAADIENYRSVLNTEIQKTVQCSRRVLHISIAIITLALLSQAAFLGGSAIEKKFLELANENAIHTIIQGYKGTNLHPLPESNPESFCNWLLEEEKTCSIQLDSSLDMDCIPPLNSLLKRISQSGYSLFNNEGSSSSSQGSAIFEEEQNQYLSTQREPCQTIAASCLSMKGISTTRGTISDHSYTISTLVSVSALAAAIALLVKTGFFHRSRNEFMTVPTEEQPERSEMKIGPKDLARLK